MQQFFKQFYSIIDLEDFLNDYFKFYKRVYGIEYYYQEYFNALMSMDKYLKKEI